METAPKKSLSKNQKKLIIACGALAKEIKFLLAQLNGDDIDLLFLPAIWHNSPQKIIPALKRLLAEHQSQYKKIYIGYADCGTGGLLDRFLVDEKLQRLPGAHCYQFFAGMEEFEDMMKKEVGSFFLTDYLARHFDELIWQDMGLAKHPELLKTMFGGYKKIVYLAQTDDPSLTELAQKASQKMGLGFERRFTGYGLLQPFIHHIHAQTL
ncbi:MAG: DUF1638 domain-containing protein [Alphaproteobacteria bacterium]